MARSPLGPDDTQARLISWNPYKPQIPHIPQYFSPSSDPLLDPLPLQVYLALLSVGVQNQDGLLLAIHSDPISITLCTSGTSHTYDPSGTGLILIHPCVRPHHLVWVSLLPHHLGIKLSFTFFTLIPDSQIPQLHRYLDTHSTTPISRHSVFKVERIFKVYHSSFKTQLMLRTSLWPISPFTQ